MRATVRLTVIKDKPYVKTPHFHTAPMTLPPNEQYYTTTGVGPGACMCYGIVLPSADCAPDLREAARDAVRAMIVYLGATHGLNRVDAYMLCSVAADLRLHEVVRAPAEPLPVSKLT